MSDPRVTVVIPCFNDGATLEDALDSVGNQEPARVVVVDDGSTDEATAHVLSRAEKRPRVEVIRHAANRGVAAARNTGVETATTRYVFLLDADDRLLAGALSRLADALDLAPDAAAAWGSYRFFGGRTSEVEVPEWDPWLVTYNNYWPGVAMLRKSAYLDLGGQAGRSRYEDWDLWMQLAERGGYGIVVRDLVFEYRVAAENSRRCAGSLDAFRSEYLVLRAAHRALLSRRRKLARTSAVPLHRRCLERALLTVKLSLPASLRRALYEWAYDRDLRLPRASMRRAAK